MRKVSLAACGATLLLVTGVAAASPAAAVSGSENSAEVLAWNVIAVQTGLAAGQTNQEGILHLAYVPRSSTRSTP